LLPRVNAGAKARTFLQCVAARLKLCPDTRLLKGKACPNRAQVGRLRWEPLTSLPKNAPRFGEGQRRPKPEHFLQCVAARLKSCPDTKHSRKRLFPLTAAGEKRWDERALSCRWHSELCRNCLPRDKSRGFRLSPGRRAGFWRISQDDTPVIGGFLATRKKQIPRRLKSPRDDKKKDLYGTTEVVPFPNIP